MSEISQGSAMDIKDPTDVIVATASSDNSLGVEHKNEEANSETKVGFKLILLFFGIFLSVFLSAVDNTILSTAIPRITTDFHSLDDAGLYGTVYQLTTIAAQPAYGKLFSMFKIKPVYLTAIFIFEVGSIIAATAQSSTILIIGRAVTGVGTSALFGGGLNIVQRSFPAKHRPFYTGILAASPNLASVLGPFLGGLLTQKASWRWCFWINVPCGAVTAVLLLFCFRSPKPFAKSNTWLQKLKEFDLPGSLLLIGAITCLLLVLQLTSTQHKFSDPKVFGCFIGFVLLTIAFIGLESILKDNAALPMRLFKDRVVWSNSLFSALTVMAFYNHIYYLPFFFQSAQDVTPLGSGIRSIPYFTSVAMLSIMTGIIISRYKTTFPNALVGTAIMTIGAGLIYTLNMDSTTAQWLGYQILCGVGAGLVLQIPFTAVQSSVKEEDVPLALAIVIFSNCLGGALTIAITQNVFINDLRKYLNMNTGGIDVQAVIEAGASAIDLVVPSAQRVFVRHAYSQALRQGFLLAICFAGAAFINCFLLPNKRRMKSATQEPLDESDNNSSGSDSLTTATSVAVKD